MKDGRTYWIEMGRRQNFIQSGLVLAGLEVTEQGARTGEQRILPWDEISVRVSIGRDTEGNLFEAPELPIWGE